MNDIRLTTPEGYFEKSLEKTLASAEKIGRRRKEVLGFCAAVVLIIGSILTVRTISTARAEKEYFAQQAEMARLDIFLEVNR